MSDYSRALFVFTEHELDGARNETAGNGTTLYFQGQFGNYYAFTASNQLLYPLTDFINNSERFPEYN